MLFFPDKVNQSYNATKRGNLNLKLALGAVHWAQSTELQKSQVCLLSNFQISST